MTTPKREQRHGIKLPKIHVVTPRESPLDRAGAHKNQDSLGGISPRNSVGLQSSLISYARSRPAPHRRHQDNLSMDMTRLQHNQNNNNAASAADYLSRISQLSSSMDAEAIP